MADSPKKILIIEDDKFLRELISNKLAKRGYELIQAVDGEQGFEKTKKEKPDVILLDLILPGIDGFEVLSKIRKEKDIAETPVLILSNLGQKEDIEKALNLGAADYLIKAHFTPEEIVEKIGEMSR